MIWLVYAALGALALWIVAGVIDEIGARRTPARVRWPGPATPPLPSPTTWHPDHAHAQPAVDGSGRHRRLGGPQ